MEVRITPSDDYSEEERLEMVRIFKENGIDSKIEGDVIGKSAEVSPIIYIIILYTASPFLAGFFTAAGESAWNKLVSSIEGIKNLHKKKQEPVLRIRVKDSEGFDVIAYLPGGNESEKALIALHGYLSKSDKTKSIFFENGEWGTTDYHRGKG